MTIADLRVMSSAGMPEAREAAGIARETPSGRERRQSERAIAYWEAKLATLGNDATVAALDLAEIHSEDWSHRFVIAVDPVVGNSGFLLYGTDFARLLDLPEKSSPHLPMVRQLPKRFAEVFNRGCDGAHTQKTAVRIEGEVEREDGCREFYRAAFIPVGVTENARPHLAFGAFNSRVEPAMAGGEGLRRWPAAMPGRRRHGEAAGSRPASPLAKRAISP